MTRGELMQAYYLEREIDSWHKELKKAANSKIEKKRIEEKIGELKKMRENVIDYIMSIEDSQTRLIFKLRCINLMEWNDIAASIGGGNTEYTVKKRFYRYMKRKGA